MAVQLTCSVAMCGQELLSTSSICSHLSRHIRDGFLVKCPFSNCTKRYDVVSSFSSHVSRYHVVPELRQKSSRNGTVSGSASTNNSQAIAGQHPVTAATPADADLCDIGCPLSSSSPGDLTGTRRKCDNSKSDEASSSSYASDSDASCSSGGSSCDPFWFYSFEVPWHAMSPTLAKCCWEKKNAGDRVRRELVRLICDEIMKVTLFPKKKALDSIAHQVVTKYPDSFMDKTCGVVIGNGHGTLTNQLDYRITNERKAMRKLRGGSNCMERPSGKKRKKHDIREYGCVNWSSTENTTAEMEKDQQWLIEGSRKAIRDKEKIKILMRSTYPLQRKHINGQVPISSLTMKWPLLFEADYMFQHYSILTGKNEAKEFIIRKMNDSWPLLQKTFNVSKSEKVKFVMAQFSVLAKWKETKEYPSSVGMLELLCAFFEEPASQLFKHMDAIAPGDYVRDVPNHPFLIVVAPAGIYKSPKEFVVTAERTAIFSTVSFCIALAYLFVSFYVFNIEYPQQLIATLEFIQRIFAEISVDGSRSSKIKKKSDVHIKVRQLMTQLRTANP